MLIPAPMKQFSCALAEKYPLIPAPMKQFEHAFTEKYSLIPAPEEQFIFLAAIVCAFQYPNKYSFISQKIRTFYIFPELLLTFYSIYDILNISIKKFLGKRIYLPPQLLSNVTDAFALQGLMRLFLFLQACIACSQPKGVQISALCRITMVTYWFTVCYRVRTEVYWHPRFVFLVNLSVWLREAVSALSNCPQTKKSATVHLAAAPNRFRSGFGFPYDRNPFLGGNNALSHHLLAAIRAGCKQYPLYGIGTVTAQAVPLQPFT